MNRFLSALLAVLLLSGPAFSQAVQQSGSVTSGHTSRWITSGVIGDAGSATNSNITEMGVTKNGGLPFCINSANTGALNRLCLTSTTNSGAKLTVTDQGGATDGTLTIDINGNSVVLPAAPGGTVLPTVLTTPAIADSAPTCFSGTDGTLKSCGGTPGTGTVTSIAAGTGIAASPDPITTSGTISLAPIASGNLLGNSSGGSAAPTVQTVGSGLSLAMDTLSIGTASVTNAMLANMANGTAKCRVTSGTGAPEDCTMTQLFSLLGSPSQGSIIYFNNSLAPVLLAPGTNGQYLQTQGAGANPQWAAVPSPIIKTVTSTDTTVRSVASSSMTNSGSSVNITGVTAGNPIQVMAYLNWGSSVTAEDVFFQIRRDTTDITPGGLAFLAGGRSPTVVTISSSVATVIDSGHGGGSVTYRLYMSTPSGTAYLGQSGSGLRAPSATWVATETTP